jgi:hypothetical protein
VSKPPRHYALRVLRYLEHRRGVHLGLTAQDELIQHVSEIISDALDEMREGFMRKPSGREPKIHD